MKKALLVLVVLSTGLVFGFGCETKKANSLALAQQCLDNTPDTSFATANACYDYIADQDSQQAYVLKCAIKLTAGGLTTSKVTKAFISLKGNGSKPQAALIITLALDTQPHMDEAMALCETAGVDSLIKIATLAKVGTAMVAATGGIGNPADPNFPSQADIDNAVANCANVPSPCNPAATGEAAVLLGGSYCSRSDADPDVCNKINQAIQTGNGDSAAIGEALFALLQ